jgi:hypothetical protein
LLSHDGKKLLLVYFAIVVEVKLFYHRFSAILL